MPSKTKKSSADGTYVTTIRSEQQPSIGANVFRKVDPGGNPYLYYEIKRYYKSAKREGYSSNMYPRNAEAIAEVAMKTAEWIRKNELVADDFIAPTDGQEITSSAPTRPQ